MGQRKLNVKATYIQQRSCLLPGNGDSPVKDRAKGLGVGLSDMRLYQTGDSGSKERAGQENTEKSA